MDDTGFKQTRAMRRLENELRPGPISRFFMSINPMTSLGEVAGKNFHDNSVTISLIMIFSLSIAIISTVMFLSMNDDNSIAVKQKNYMVAVMSISWFVFANFTFLVIEATRLFNILLFVTLVSLLAMTVTDLDQSSTDAKLGLAAIVLGATVITVLSYFFLFTRSGEVTQLKTLEKERIKAEKYKLLIEQIRKDANKQAKEALTEDVTSKEGIKNKIATAYIDALESKIRKEILAPKTKEKDDKDKKKDDKDKKKDE